MKCPFCNKKTFIANKSEYMIECFCETCKAQFLYFQDDLNNKRFVLDRTTLQTVINNKQYQVSMFKDLSTIHYVKNQKGQLILSLNFNLNLTPFNINKKLQTIITFS